MQDRRTTGRFHREKFQPIITEFERELYFAGACNPRQERYCRLTGSSEQTFSGAEANCELGASVCDTAQLCACAHRTGTTMALGTCVAMV